MATEYKVKGINDDTDTCSCCGKTGLKRVVWLAVVIDGEESDPSSFGTTCAAIKLGCSRRTKAQTERAISARAEIDMKMALDAKVKAIRANMWTVRNCFLPVDLAIEVQRNGMPLEVACTERNRRFPILEYFNGKLSLEQAVRMI